MFRTSGYLTPTQSRIAPRASRLAPDMEPFLLFVGLNINAPAPPIAYELTLPTAKGRLKAASIVAWWTSDWILELVLVSFSFFSPLVKDCNSVNDRVDQKSAVPDANRLPAE